MHSGFEIFDNLIKNNPDLRTSKEIKKLNKEKNCYF